MEPTKDLTKLPPMVRTATLQVVRASEQSDSEDVVHIAISSEEPVDRAWFIEILDHQKKSIDLKRSKRGLPFMAVPNIDGSHRAGVQVGIVEDIAVGDDRVLRGVVRFSKGAYAQEMLQDIKDGIRPFVSVGYRIHEMVLEKSDKSNETYRVTKWEPVEVSSVPAPADITVGVGRSAAGDPQAVRIIIPESAARAGEEHAVETQAQAAPGGAAETTLQTRTVDPANPQVRVNDRGQSERTTTILTLASLHGVAVARAQEWIGSEKSVNEIAQELAAEARAGNRTLHTPQNPIDLSEKDRKRYSVTRAIAQAAGLEKAGFESEVSTALERALPSGSKRNGNFLIPTIGVGAGRAEDFAGISQRAGLDTATATKGAESVFTTYGGWLEKLRNRAMVLQLGATFLPGLRDQVGFVKQVGSAGAVWVAENPGADNAMTELTLALITLAPKTLMGSTFYTRQLLAQNSVDIDNKVENDLVKEHALAIDLAALHGTGADNQPTGVYVAAGVNPVAFGGAVTFAKVVAMETAVAADNADLAGLAYLATPEVRGAAKTLPRFANADTPIWTGTAEAGEMNGYRAAATNQLKKNMGAGVNEHGLVFGAWPELMIGEWNVLDIVVDPYSRKNRGVIEVTSFQMVDIQLAYADAFAKATGLTAA